MNRWSLIVFCGAALVTVEAHATGDPAAGKERATTCASCHGPAGQSANPQWPNLAGQVPGYIAKQLRDFKNGRRQDPLMAGIVKGLNEKDMANLDAYFSGLPAQHMAMADAARKTPGERVFRGGNAKTGVSACMSCHGPSGHGIPPRFPRVAGQHAAYAEKQLLDFKRSTRNNDDTTMTRIAFRMSEDEIRAVADYMQGLQ